MSTDLIYNFINQHRYAVISTVQESIPQSALIGIAVSEELELIFDTVKTSRKYQNIQKNPLVSIVVGWDNETTLQYQGKAIELKNEEDNGLKEIYFKTFPDGRLRAETLPEIVHFK